MKIKSKPDFSQLLKSLESYLKIGHIDINSILKQSISAEVFSHTANGKSTRFNNYIKNMNYVNMFGKIKNIFRLMLTKGSTYGSQPRTDLFRGTILEEIMNNGLTGFISTTTDIDQARSFTLMGLKDAGRVLLKMVIDPDVMCIVPKALTNNLIAYEDEVLLAPFCNIEYGPKNSDGTVTAHVTNGVLESSDVTLDQILSEQEAFSQALDNYDKLSKKLVDCLYDLKEFIFDQNIYII